MNIYQLKMFLLGLVINLGTVTKYPGEVENETVLKSYQNEHARSFEKYKQCPKES